MKCFMHPQVDAISVCKRCGKAMCADCSSYSGHSGICPACKKEEHEQELWQLTSQMKNFKSSIIKNSILAVIIAIISIVLAIVISPIALAALVVDIYFGYKIFKCSKDIKAMNERKAYIVGEINKISGALSKGTGII